METKDLEYFDDCHTVEVVGLCQIDVLVLVQGSKYVQGKSKAYQ